MLFSTKDSYLLDYYVHAFIYPENWVVMQNTLSEENVYNLKNFRIVIASEKLRPVSSDINVIFSNSTTTQIVPLEVSTIRRHKFEIVELCHVYNSARMQPPNEAPEFAVGKFSTKKN